MKRNSAECRIYNECPTITPMKVEKNPAYDPKIIPLIGSAMKIQLYHTLEMSGSGPTSESQTTLNAAKTAISETADDSLSFSTHIHFTKLLPIQLLLIYFLKVQCAASGLRSLSAFSAM